MPVQDAKNVKIGPCRLPASPRLCMHLTDETADPVSSNWDFALMLFRILNAGRSGLGQSSISLSSR